MTAPRRDSVAILRRALELACAELVKEGYCLDGSRDRCKKPDDVHCDDCWGEHFIALAKRERKEHSK